MKTRKKQITGTARMMANGAKASQLWYTPADYQIVKLAAKLDRRSMANFARNAAVNAAKLTLHESYENDELIKKRRSRRGTQPNDGA